MSILQLWLKFNRYPWHQVLLGDFKVLLGDFNIDFSVQQKNANFLLKRRLRGITEAFDLKQLIMEPTRVTEYSETLIDLVFTNSHHKVVKSGVFDLGLSDHSLVYCVLKSGRPRVAPKTIEYRSYKNYNKDLEIIPWHVVFNNTDNVDDCVNTWNKLFLDVVEAHAPIKTQRVRGS